MSLAEAVDLRVRLLGELPYVPVWQAMQRFTQERGPDTLDEIWLLQHPPVFTQGQAGKPEHLLMPGDIPVVPVDRGGQVTYHGPGQLVGYLLLDIGRRQLGTRALVTRIEQALVALLADWGIDAEARSDAPGVYTQGRKIASLGLRIRRGCSFHGLALNVDMDLEPFRRINPCGYAGLAMTQVKEFCPEVAFADIRQQLLDQLIRQLGYSSVEVTEALPEGVA